jgi:hypothetical protein
VTLTSCVFKKVSTLCAKREGIIYDWLILKLFDKEAVTETISLLNKANNKSQDSEKSTCVLDSSTSKQL